MHFASSDGAVRERAAGFGDDGDGVVEERSPGGVGGACDEDRAFGEGGEVFDAADEVSGAFGLTRAAREAGEDGGGGVGAKSRRAPARRRVTTRRENRRARRLALRYRTTDTFPRQGGPFAAQGRLKVGHYGRGCG